MRSRRDFPKLLGLIEASAYLHQNHRNQDDGILASAEDYRNAKRVFEWSYEAGPDRTVRQLLNEAARFAGEFSVCDLMTSLRWGHSKAYEVLSRGKEIGCVAEGASRGRYKFLRAHPSPALQLPDVVGPDEAVLFRFSAEIPPLVEIQ